LASTARRTFVRIGEVAAATGVSPRALRYYEEKGLLTSDRRSSGQRAYSQEAVDRVKWIQALYAAGLNSKAVTGLLPCLQTGLATDEMMSQLAAERDRITAQIDDLTGTRDRLDAMISATRTSAPGRTYPCVD
jgi:DNA-binding transcriptional MerR regulator